MKIYSLLALMGATVGIQTSAQSEGVYINGLNGTLSSEYIQKVSDSLNTVRRDALKVEKSEAERMIKYYQGVLNKSQSDMGKLKSENQAAPTPVKLGPRKKAIMSDGAKTSFSSYWDNNWKYPRLDSKTGIHIGQNQAGKTQYWTTEFAGDGSKKYQVDTLMYMTRADRSTQYLTAVKIEYFDGKQWKSYKNGEWLKTGAKSSFPASKIYNVWLEPPINGATKVRIVADKEHAVGTVSGRFDWVTAEEL